MSTGDERKQGRNALTRREFVTRPFKWLAREPSPPWPGQAVPGRIPLSALKDIPEAALMRMVPVLRQGWSACVCEAGIAYRDDSGQEGTVSLSPEGCKATRLFDGVRTLAQAAAALDAELGITPGLGVAIVRDAFLTLAMREVYHPNGPPPPLYASPAEGQNA
jgi:hypothetical protein